MSTSISPPPSPHPPRRLRRTNCGKVLYRFIYGKDVIALAAPCFEPHCNSCSHHQPAVNIYDDSGSSYDCSHHRESDVSPTASVSVSPPPALASSPPIDDDVHARRRRRRISLCDALAVERAACGRGKAAATRVESGRIQKKRRRRSRRLEAILREKEKGGRRGGSVGMTTSMKPQYRRDTRSRYGLRFLAPAAPQRELRDEMGRRYGIRFLPRTRLVVRLRGEGLSAYCALLDGRGGEGEEEQMQKVVELKFSDVGRFAGLVEELEGDGKKALEAKGERLFLIMKGETLRCVWR